MKCLRCWKRKLGAGLLSASLAAAPGFAYEPPEEPKVLVSRLGGSYLGVGVAEVDSSRARSLNLKEERGVEITRVEDDGPAAKGGLKVGDVVLEYNGQRVEGMDQFIRMVRETPAGRDVRLTVARSGGVQTIAMKTGVRKAQVLRMGEPMQFEMRNFEMPEIRIPDVPKTFMSWRSSALGIEAESLESQLAEYFGVKDGVLVRSVLKGSAADRAGLKAGDVILKVDDTKVTSPREVSSAMRAARSRSNVVLQLMRERREMTVTVQLDEVHSGRRTGQ